MRYSPDHDTIWFIFSELPNPDGSRPRLKVAFMGKRHVAFYQEMRPLIAWYRNYISEHECIDYKRGTEMLAYLVGTHIIRHWNHVWINREPMKFSVELAISVCVAVPELILYPIDHASNKCWFFKNIRREFYVRGSTTI